MYESSTFRSCSYPICYHVTNEWIFRKSGAWSYNPHWNPNIKHIVRFCLSVVTLLWLSAATTAYPGKGHISAITSAVSVQPALDTNISTFGEGFETAPGIDGENSGPIQSNREVQVHSYPAHLLHT